MLFFNTILYLNHVWIHLKPASKHWIQTIQNKTMLKQKYYTYALKWDLSASLWIRNRNRKSQQKKQHRTYEVVSKTRDNDKSSSSNEKKKKKLYEMTAHKRKSFFSGHKYRCQARRKRKDDSKLLNTMTTTISIQSVAMRCNTCQHQFTDQVDHFALLFIRNGILMWLYWDGFTLHFHSVIPFNLSAFALLHWSRLQHLWWIEVYSKKMAQQANSRQQQQQQQIVSIADTAIPQYQLQVNEIQKSSSYR